MNFSELTYYGFKKNEYSLRVMMNHYLFSVKYTTLRYKFTVQPRAENLYRIQFNIDYYRCIINFQNYFPEGMVFSLNLLKCLNVLYTDE